MTDLDLIKNIRDNKDNESLNVLNDSFFQLLALSLFVTS